MKVTSLPRSSIQTAAAGSLVAFGIWLALVLALIRPGHVPDPLGLGAFAWPALCGAASVPILVASLLTRTWRRTPLDPYLALSVVASVLATITAYDRAQSGLYVLALAANLCVFFATLAVIRRHTLAAPVLFAGLVAGIAVLETLGLCFHLEVGISTRPATYLQPAGWSGYPELGHLAAIQIAILVATLSLARSRTVRLAALLLLAIGFVQLTLLYARVAWIAVAAVVVVAAVHDVRWGRWRRWALALALVVLVGGMAVASSPTLRYLASGTIGIGEAPAVAGVYVATPEMRLEIWRRTLQMIADHPLLGVGPGNFQAVYEPNYNPQVNDDGRRGVHAHNLWLHQIAELGIPGGLAYAALWVAVLVLGWRRQGWSLSHRAAFYAVVAAAGRSLGDNLFAFVGGPGGRLYTLTWILFAIIATEEGSRLTAQGAATVRPSTALRTNGKAARHGAQGGLRAEGEGSGFEGTRHRRARGTHR